MTEPLAAAVRVPGLPDPVSASGRMVALEGERRRVYVAEAPREVYDSRCDDPANPAVEHQPDPIQ